MNIRQLEAFRATVQTGTASGAAEMMGLTQPAVSKLLVQLEAELGVPLFERGSNRLALTPEGAMVYDGVDRTLVAVDKVRAIAKDAMAAKVGNVRIAATPAIANNLLPLAISRFRATHPDVSICVSVQTTTILEEWIAAQHIDFGLSYSMATRPSLKSEPFFKDQQALIVPKGHALSACKVAEPRDLEGLPYISIETRSKERYLIDQIFETRNVRREMILEVPLNETVSRLVELGQGVGLVDSFTAYGFAKRGGRVIPFEPRLEFDVFLQIPTHRPISRAARRFLTTLKACRDEMHRGIRPP